MRRSAGGARKHLADRRSDQVRKIGGGVARGTCFEFVRAAVCMHGQDRRWSGRLHAVCADAQAGAAFAAVGRTSVVFRWNGVGRVVVRRRGGCIRRHALVVAGRHVVLVMRWFRGRLHRFALRHRMPQRHLRGRHRRRRPVENERQDEHHTQKQWAERHVFTLTRPAKGMTRLPVNRLDGALPLGQIASFVCSLAKLCAELFSA